MIGIVPPAVMIATVSAAVMASSIAKAEPKMLTVPQLEAVTAAGLIPDINLSVPINVTLGGVALQNNVTNQTAVAFAFGFANCIACADGVANAIANALSLNGNLTGQGQQQ